MGHTIEMGRAADSNDKTPADGVNVPGLVAASAWAVAFLAGLLALALGNFVTAVMALGVAITAPWLGLAWVTRDRAHQPVGSRGEFETK